MADSETGTDNSNDLEQMIRKLMKGNGNLNRQQAEAMAKRALARMSKKGSDSDGD